MSSPQPQTALGPSTRDGQHWGRLLLRPGALLVFLAYALLVVLSFETCLAGATPNWGDAAPNYYRVLTDARLKENTGRTRGYDHQIFAGYKHGAINTNSHGVSLAVRLVGRVASLPRAFGLVAVLSLLVIPLALGYLGTRFGRAPVFGGWGIVALYSGLIMVDRLPALLIKHGTAAWPLATLVVLAICLSLVRLLEAPSRARALGTLALLPLLAVHVLAPPTLAFCTVLIGLVHVCRGGQLKRLLWLLGAGAAGVALNSWWLVPLLGDLGATPGTAEGLVAVPLDLLKDLGSVFAVRTGTYTSSCGLRLSLLTLGAYGWWSLRKREPLVAPTALVLLVGTFLWSYSGFVPALARLQPYRNQLLAFAFAALAWPAGLRALREACRRGWTGRVAGVVLLAASLPSVAVGLNALRTEPLLLRAPRPSLRVVLKGVASLPSERGRLLVEGVSSDRVDVNLAIAGDVSCLTFSSPEVVGAAGRASWRLDGPGFFGRDPATLKPEEIQAELERYGVAWVLVRSRRGLAMMDKLDPSYFLGVASLAGPRLYALARPSGWFVEGRGQIRLSPGRIDLSELSGPVTLRFHFLPRLQAEPGVTLSPDPRGGALPFLRVDPGPREAVSLEWKP